MAPEVSNEMAVPPKPRRHASLMLEVKPGRRGHPHACDCCNRDLTGEPSAAWRWYEIEVGPASFAWAICSDCNTSGRSEKKHWSDKALVRAYRYTPSWGKAVERMILGALQ